jgi:glycolate oxidase FAD binding subunit
MQPGEITSQKGDGTLNDKSLIKGVETLESLGVRVKHVEQPLKESDVKDILAKASREKLVVFPIGGGTAISAGVMPESVDIALDTTKMNAVADFDSANLNMKVQAGMTVGAINEYLAGQGKGFRIPLDPPFSDRATIGGVYAANSSGPSRLRFGTIRDQVLGVQALDASGTEVKFGGRVVKNVSGYDMTKFLIGSAGSLCLITGVIMRVYPMPSSASVCEATFAKLDELERFLESLRGSFLLPSGVIVEVVNGGYRVIAGFEEHPLAVERESKDFLSMAAKFGGKGSSKIGRQEMQAAFRDAVEPKEEGISVKITVPISEGPRVLAAAKKLLPQSKAVLYAGNGVICVYAGQMDADIIKQLKGLINNGSGYVIPVRLHRTLLSAWGPRVDQKLEQYVLQPIKKQLDPLGVFPPVL